jgi:hypothetical protein
MQIQIFIKKAFIISTLFCFSINSYAQKNDSTNVKTEFSGTATITNNGVALIPAFSLGKPAMMFDFVARGKKLSFEPSMYFAVEGAKPWAFFFWVRYKLVNSTKFKFNIGVHPSFLFSNTVVINNGTTQDVLKTNRYWVGELSPNYLLSKNISLSVYYLYGKGATTDVSQNTQFLALNAVFSNIKLSNKFYMRLVPQVYYLNIDNIDGFYASSSLVLVKKNFPISISAMASKSIKINMGGEGFVSNIGLSYSY